METIVLKRKYFDGMTDQEFFDFCQEYENLKIERDAQGNILIMAPTGSDTGHKNIKITARLQMWAEKDGTGLAFDNNTGFTLPNHAMRSPDTAWLTLQKWNQLTVEQKEGFAPVCPDFVMELRSKTDRLKESRDKMEEWIANGCRLAWLIDPTEEKAYIYRPDREVETVASFDAKLSGEEVLAGFELDLSILK
jgi:Uma2 family endonuclease